MQYSVNVLTASPSPSHIHIHPSPSLIISTPVHSPHQKMDKIPLLLSHGFLVFHVMIGVCLCQLFNFLHLLSNPLRRIISKNTMWDYLVLRKIQVT